MHISIAQPAPARRTPHRTIDRRRAGCGLSRESRFARDFGTTRFGSEGYAIEELVAELGAAYIANWLDVLKADNRAIFTAASHAQRAAAFINGPAAGGLRRLITDRGIRAHRIRPIDILYVVTYSHTEHL